MITYLSFLRGIKSDTPSLCEAPLPPTQMLRWQGKRGIPHDSPSVLKGWIRLVGDGVVNKK